jgi:uncharacterized protein (DUF2141 family)
VRRTLFLAALVLPLSFAAAAQSAKLASPACTDDGVPLRVAVSGLRSGDGNLTVTVYGDRPADFLAPGAKLTRKRTPIVGATTEVCLNVPAPGTYAIAVYHDENNDRDFNRTFIGMPKEGYGFSNDAPALAGLPSFDDARFDAPADGRRLEIRMRY